jgi:hypothetical protein
LDRIRIHALLEASTLAGIGVPLRSPVPPAAPVSPEHVEARKKHQASEK